MENNYNSFSNIDLCFKEGIFLNMVEESFENKMENLEKIVAELEKGDLSLDKSVSKFEEGMKLSKECSKMLEDAQKKITILLEEDGEIKEEDFDTDMQ